VRVGEPCDVARGPLADLLRAPLHAPPSQHEHHPEAARTGSDAGRLGHHDELQASRLEVGRLACTEIVGVKK
jgi:hypothetical protein